MKITYAATILASMMGMNPSGASGSNHSLRRTTKPLEVGVSKHDSADMNGFGRSLPSVEAKAFKSAKTSIKDYNKVSIELLQSYDSMSSLIRTESNGRGQ